MSKTIENLKKLKSFHNGSYGEDIDKAIKALEQEPCEDAISRENTLKAMIEQLGIRNEDYLIPAEATLYKVVKNMPPVIPQPKTVLYSGDGYADGQMVYDMAECPNCGYDYEDGDKDWGLPFCPNCGQSLDWNCGTKMEVKE